MKNSEILLLGIPLDLGAENLGVDVAPSAFRDHKIVKKLVETGLKVLDGKDIDVEKKENIKVGDQKSKFEKEVVRVSEKVAEKVYQTILKKQKILAIGGDHSISLGTISGAASAIKDLGIIYLDTHADMNTKDSTLSGNIHGMHVASVIGYGSEELINIFRKGRKVKKENILLVGGNDFDNYEVDFIKENNIATFEIFDLLSEGMSPLFRSINELSKRVSNIWVSLDLDVIDYVYAPGVGIPNTGGLTYREISTICNYIGKNCKVIGMDVVEYNPLKDVEGKTAELAIELIAKVFGKDYSPYTKYMGKNKIKNG